MTKEIDGIESDDRERGRKEQCSETKDEERTLRGRRMITRKTNGERSTENITCRKVTWEKVTAEKEGGTRGQERRGIPSDRRKDEGKKGSESRCDKREVNNRDDDRKKRQERKEQQRRWEGENSTTR